MEKILSPKEYQVLILRYGLHNGEFHTLEEVGQIYGVTRERIRQIENKAIEKIRKSKYFKHIQDFQELVK